MRDIFCHSFFDFNITNFIGKYTQLFLIFHIECRNWAMSICLVNLTVLQLQGFLHLQSHRQAGDAAEFLWPSMYDTACRWCDHCSKCVFISIALIWVCRSQPMGPCAPSLFVYAGANTTLNVHVNLKHYHFYPWIPICYVSHGILSSVKDSQ